MEKIHGKLVIRAQFIHPSPTKCFIEPIIYTKQYVTKEEAHEEFEQFQEVNAYDNDTHNGKYGRLIARWIPYPEYL